MSDMTKSAANYSTAIGDNCQALHDHCIIIGNGLKSEHEFHMNKKTDSFKINADFREKPELIKDLHKYMYHSYINYCPPYQQQPYKAREAVLDQGLLFSVFLPLEDTACLHA